MKEPVKSRAYKAGTSMLSRREFIGAAAAFAIVPRRVLGGPGNMAASDKLNIACIGVGGMGANDVRQVETENIVALCDVDFRHAAETFRRFPQDAGVFEKP